MTDESPREPLDSFDRRLIHILGEEPADPATVAAALGTDVAEVERRIARLQEQEVIGDLTIRVEPGAAGLPLTAFFLLQVAQNAATYSTIESLIRDIDQVEEAHAVSGRCDWIVKVRAETLADVQNLLTGQLALLPGFVRAETLVVLSTACDRINVPAATFPPAP